MPNMRMTKNPMPSQDPNVRNKNFKEVTLGYTEEMALDEAQRCLNCKNMPCVSGCPVNIHIPEFIKKIAEHDFEGAYQVIAQSSSLPAVCGRVCPQETQCEGKCVRGIKGEPVGIGRLERFVADWHNAHATVATITAPKNGHKVAVIGSGPAGLTCAGDLAKLGYDVTIYEALHLAGGVLVYGTSNFINLPRWYVEGLNGTAVIDDFQVNGKIVIATADEEHDAVPIVTAAGLTKTMAPRTPETISELPLPRIDCDIHDYYRNIAAVVNGEAEQIVTHDQQRQLMKLMEAIFESAEKNQVVYF